MHLMRSKSESGKAGSGQVVKLENMDPMIARQTAKTLQAVLLEKPSSKASLHSNLRYSAAELIFTCGRTTLTLHRLVCLPVVCCLAMEMSAVKCSYSYHWLKHEPLCRDLCLNQPRILVCHWGRDQPDA